MEFCRFSFVHFLPAAFRRSPTHLAGGHPKLRFQSRGLHSITCKDKPNNKVDSNSTHADLLMETIAVAASLFSAMIHQMLQGSMSSNKKIWVTPFRQVVTTILVFHKCNNNTQNIHNSYSILSHDRYKLPMKKTFQKYKCLRK